MMHTRFPYWHKQFQPEADQDSHEKRWAIAENYGSELSEEEIVHLLSLFLFQPGEDHPGMLSLKEFFEQEDETFPEGDTRGLLRALAGACIVALLSKESTIEADAIALGLKSAAFPKKRLSTPFTEAFALADKYLIEQGDAMRPKIEAPAADLEGIRAHLTRATEELEILWWLLSDYSEILATPIPELDSSSYALVAAFELNSRSTILPANPAIGPILARAVRGCRSEKKAETTLERLVEASRGDWQKRVLDDSKIAKLAPILPIYGALCWAQKVDKTAAWTAIFEQNCVGVSSKLKLTPSEGASQLFCELQFLSALRQL